jgi:hypothetical protein
VTARITAFGRFGLALAALLVAGPGLAGCNSSATPTPPPGFHDTGPMSVGRLSHVAVTLEDGKVLVAGGYNSASSTLRSAELYDPASGTFSATGSMSTERAGATATLLPDGEVLVAGGFGIDDSGATVPVASAELYDPDTGLFTATGSMYDARYNSTATLLSSGLVLIAGGTGEHGTLSEAELYDYRAHSFRPAGALNMARTGHAATLLADGRVLLAGGLVSTVGGALYLATAEIYDPGSGKFTATGSMTLPRYVAMSGRLPDGRVLIFGGLRYVDAMHKYSDATAELYDPATGAFTATGSMANPRAGAGTLVLPDGRVLAVGGVLSDSNWSDAYLASAEAYDPEGGHFTFAGSMTTPRYGPTATLLKDGRVLVAGGGNSDGIVATAEVYQP